MSRTLPLLTHQVPDPTPYVCIRTYKCTSENTGFPAGECLSLSRERETDRGERECSAGTVWYRTVGPGAGSGVRTYGTVRGITVY